MKPTWEVKASLGDEGNEEGLGGEENDQGMHCI